MKKRGISFLLALVMVVSMLAPEALAAKPAEAGFDVHSATSVNPTWPNEGSLRLSKSAEWVDKKNGLAKIALTVEGVPITTPASGGANLVFLVDTSQGMYKPDGYCAADVYDPDKGQYYCGITGLHYPLTSTQTPETPNIAREHRTEIAQALDKNGSAVGGRMGLVQNGMKEFLAKLSTSPDNNVSIVSYGTKGNTVLDWTGSGSLSTINSAIDSLLHEALPKDGDTIYRAGSMCQKCGDECPLLSKGATCACDTASGCTACKETDEAACKAFQQCPKCGDYCSQITQAVTGGEWVNACSCDSVTPDTTCEGCHQNKAVPCSGVLAVCTRCHHRCAKGEACDCGESGTKPCTSCVDIPTCERCHHHCAAGSKCACDISGAGACAGCLIEVVCGRCLHHCRLGVDCGCGTEGILDCTGCVKETVCGKCDHLCLKGADCECGDGTGFCAYCVRPDLCPRCGNLCRRGATCKCTPDASCAECYVAADCAKCGNLCLKGVDCPCANEVGTDGKCVCEYCFSESVCAKCDHLCKRSEDCLCGEDDTAPCKYCYIEADCSDCNHLCMKGAACTCDSDPTADCEFCVKKEFCKPCRHLCEYGIKCTCGPGGYGPCDGCTTEEPPSPPTTAPAANTVLTLGEEAVPLAAGRALAPPNIIPGTAGNALKPVPAGQLPFLPGSNIRNYSAALYEAKKQVEKAQSNGKPTLVIMLSNDPANVGLKVDAVYGKGQAEEIKALGAEIYGVAICGDKVDVKSGITGNSLKPLVSADVSGKTAHVQIADLTDTAYQSGADNPDRLSVAQALERVCAPYFKETPAATDLVLTDTINNEFFGVYYTTKPGEGAGSELIPMVSEGVQISGNTATIAIDQTTGKAQEFFIWVQVNGGVLQFNNKPTNLGNAKLEYQGPDGNPGSIEVESPIVSWVREYTVKYNLAALYDPTDSDNPNNPTVVIADQLLPIGSTILLHDAKDSAGNPILSFDGRTIKGWIDYMGNRFVPGSEFTAEKAAALGCNQSVVLMPRLNGILSFSVVGGAFHRIVPAIPGDLWNPEVPMRDIPLGPYFEMGTKDADMVLFPNNNPLPDPLKETITVVKPVTTGTLGTWYQRVDNELVKLDTTENIPAVDGAHYVLSYIPKEQMVRVLLDADAHGTIAYEKTKLFIGEKGNQLKDIIGATIPTVIANSGWNLDKWQSGDVTMTEGTLTQAVNEDITYVAKYDALVTFDPAGGSFVSDHSTGRKAQWVHEGDAVADKPAEKSGYQFLGWYKGEVKFDFTTPITEPTTLVAHYEENSSTTPEPPKPKRVTVTLDAATHGTIDGGKTKRYEGTRGDTLGSILGTSSVPGVSAESGWRLADWQGQGGAMSDSSLSTAVESNQTYTAKYDVQVIFDPNGGAFAADGGKANKTEWVSEGGTLSGDKTAEKPRATFDGWYEGDVKANLTKPVTRPMRLVARYVGTGLSVDKSYDVARVGANHSSIRVDDTVTYTLLVRNDGDTALENIQVTDAMFAQADGGKVELDGKSAAVTGNALTIARLETRKTAKITYAYTVKDSDANKSLYNLATVESGGSTDTSEVTTGRVEGMQDIKLYYAAEQLNAAGTGISTPAKLAEPLVVLSKYPGERITRAELEQAIAAKVLPALARDGVSINEGYSRIFYQAGSTSTTWDTSATEIAESYLVKESDNRFYAGYPLKRLTMTYQPGTGGTVAPQPETKGAAAGGSAVFTLPYGAMPGIWFGTDTPNGALAVACVGKSGNQFNGWQPEPVLERPVTSNQSYTAQWRKSTFAVRVEIYAGGKLVDTRTDLRLTDVTASTAKLLLNAGKLLTEEQSLGKMSQGYRFVSYALGGQTVTTAEHTFDVRSGDVVRVDYQPYDLAVWHISGRRKVFDAAQSVAVLTANTQARTNGALVNNATYSTTTVTVDGRTVPGYGETVDVLSDRGPWEVVFRYTPKGGTGGEDEDELIDIFDPEIPLAPGLNMTDHFAYIIGYPDGMVRPEGYMTRDELAAVFFRLLDAESRERLRTEESPFNDMTLEHWANTEIATLNSGGILLGYDDGGFHPGSYVTRGEMAAIAARFQSGVYDGEDIFPDIGGHWAAEYINRAARYGWVRGKDDGLFHPDDSITRAEVMTLVNSVLYRQTQPDGMLSDMIVWPDNTPDKWYYNAVQEATNSHNFEREMPFDPEAWTALYPTPKW